MIDSRQEVSLQEIKTKIITNNIYSIIKNNKDVSFDYIFKTLLKGNVTNSKQELSQYLRILEGEKNIFQLGGIYYDLESFKNIEGFAQWNLTGFCWLENKDSSNDYGITLNSSDNLLTIFNKRDLGYGSFIKGKHIELEDRSFVYVTEMIPGTEKKLIGTVDLEKNRVFSLSGNTNYSFPIVENNTLANGDIAVFNSNDFSVLELLGNKSEKGIEDKIIILLNDLKEAPEISLNKVVKNSIKLDKLFFTIDSPYTSDIDDAIATEIIADKNQVKIYIGIADVSSYVKPGDVLDLHAQEQSSSFYLPNKTIHMLSKEIATQYCSLNVGESKSSMVCELTYNLDDWKLIESNFYQAEIKSKARLTYDDVDRIMDVTNPQESFISKNNAVEKFIHLDQFKELVDSLKVLQQFSENHKSNVERDYWVVETPEYVLGEDGKISHLEYRDENKLSQKMVETAMLAANIAAAEFLNENLPESGLFRNQNSPEEGKRPKPATYGTENLGHWGLQKKAYTQFTSPIRRYCDLMVHRLIKSIVHPQNNDKISSEKISENVEQMNYQAYKAKQNDLKSYNLLLSQYIEKMIGERSMDTKVEFVDFTENGAVFKNKQHIEFFVPTFKLEYYVTKVIDTLLPKNEENIELSITEKKLGLEKLNSTWDVFLMVYPYSWTDERKNVSYEFSRKENTLNLENKKLNNI